MEKTKRYPTCCTSMYCGNFGDTCLSCRNYPKLKEWKEWKEATEAKCVDPTWSPNSYIASIGETK